MEDLKNTFPCCECYALDPHVAESEKILGNWILNKFEYFGGVVAVVLGVEHKNREVKLRISTFPIFF